MALRKDSLIRCCIDSQDSCGHRTQRTGHRNGRRKSRRRACVCVVHPVAALRLQLVCVHDRLGVRKMFAHEAHHRGQVIMLAHHLGYRLPVEAWAGIWWWDKLWKQCGFGNESS